VRIGSSASATAARAKKSLGGGRVERDGDTAKFWLSPVRLHSSGGFRSAEIRRIHRIV